jgi:hypothetical protein
LSPRERPPFILDPDRFEALLSDAKRHGSSFSIALPGQQRAMDADLFKQPSVDELAFRTASSVTFVGRSTP